MIENTISLLPVISADEKPLKAIVFAIDEDSAEELKGLLFTLNILVAQTLVNPIRKIQPATYVGKGLLEEKIKGLIEVYQPHIVAFDLELSAKQSQNCQDILGIPVLDRPGIILEIFSQNAKTKEAKTQVAMARLKYLLPRLTHLWSHFERQQGGGAISRGMGEKQLEVDRRLVKNRLTQLQIELDAIQKERENRRKKRKNFYKIALVGYTNAGKSTLLNALTHSDVLVANKLFATLDSSARVLDPISSPPVIIMDTVGFIHKLPPSLVASFRSTLEELFEADLLVHVLNASHPNVIQHQQVTEIILKEMGLADKPLLLVLNKIDKMSDQEKHQIKATFFLKKDFGITSQIMMSAQSTEDIIKLRNLLLQIVQKDLILLELVIPYSEANLEAKMYAFGQVDQRRYLEKGIFFKVRMEQRWIKKLGLKKYQTAF